LKATKSSQMKDKGKVKLLALYRN